MESNTATLPVTITLDASAATMAWLNAFLACSQSEERTVLYRTLSIEFFDTGVQFIACDGTMLFRSWTPALNAIARDWPLSEEVPNLRIIVMDAEKFAHGFMNTLRSAIGDLSFELTLTVDQEESEQPALSDDLTPNVLMIEAMNQQLHCRLLDDVYPDWRALRFGIDPAEQVDGMKIGRKMFATVGRLKGVEGVDMTFHNDARRIDFVASGTFAEVRGMLAPMRREEKHVEKDEEK